ncbi:hypothetical protein [Pseudonocardia sp. GCM10023141]|uniref:hypothetical protein n=1 Tax=Pseudonocardia sp. GCM10023141 TaxID=3252653 RepID=UPI0036064945
MIVRIAAAGAVVLDADDCTRLHVETDLDVEALAKALAETGSGTPADAESVWLDVGVLRSRAQLLVDAPDWPQRWEAMIGYAQRKGWLSPDGHSVQAHIQR